MQNNISTERIVQLNLGLEQTTTLMDALVVDMKLLCSNVFPQLPPVKFDDSLGIVKRMQLVARHLVQHSNKELQDFMIQHSSDTVRGWACYYISQNAANIEIVLPLIEPLANDPHFGVREWAWMAVRPLVAQDIDRAVALLLPWTQHCSANIRRFASELTRPRGVWCSHLNLLKEEPWRGLPIIEELKSDPHKYVQNSVGNWLNDAAKSQPAWVKQICQEWLAASSGKETIYICKRGQRGLA